MLAIELFKKSEMQYPFVDVTSWKTLQCMAHRFKKPAYKAVSVISHIVFIKAFYEYGEKHRNYIDGPAYEAWHDNGHKLITQYYTRGRTDREPNLGAAILCYNNLGVKTLEIFEKNGVSLS